MKQRLSIIYCGRFPSEKAAALFVAENAKALAAWYDVRIIVPKREGVITNSLAGYTMPPSVEVTYLSSIDVFKIPGLSKVAFYVNQITFSLSLLWYLRTIPANEILIANDVLPGLVASFRGKLLFEVHDYPTRALWVYCLLFSHSSIILATNEWKKIELKKQFPASSNKVYMERNGVDIEAFSPSITKEEARSKVQLPQQGKIVLYTGHLYSWKGVDTFVTAARLLPNIRFICVGGTSADVEWFKKEYADVPNLSFTGHVPHSEVSLWQSAADVLVLPNTAREMISVRYTSPMKLFEYMASGRPIVASRLPSIMELVDSTTAYLFEPDSAESLVQEINVVFSTPEEASTKALRAQQSVSEFSWQKRALRLKELLERA